MQTDTGESRPPECEAASQPLSEKVAARLRSRAVVEAMVLGLVLAIFGLAVYLIASSNVSSGAALLTGDLVAVGTYRTIRVTREGQITDRMTKAVEQLAARRDDSHEPDEVLVLGGIYALERIARESDHDYGSIMEILTAYIRTRVDRTHGTAPREAATFPNDVQAALAVLGRRRKAPWGFRNLRLDLTNTYLRAAKLPEAELSRALLTNADLSGADLKCAKLSGAELSTAIVNGTHFAGAKGIELDLPSTIGVPHCTPDQTCDLPN